MERQAVYEKSRIGQSVGHGKRHVPVLDPEPSWKVGRFAAQDRPLPRRARAYRRIQVHVLRKFAVGSLWSAGRSTRPTARCIFKVRSASATNPA
jgi:hypothetical protein